MELLKWLVEEKGLDVQEWNKVFCSPCTFNNCTCIAECSPLIFTFHNITQFALTDAFSNLCVTGMSQIIS